MDPNRVCELLERTAALIRAEERRLAGEFELHPVHIHALRYLARCNRYSDNPAAVTEYLGVTKGTASQTLRVLKERGLIESHQDADDGRKQHLRPTRSGARIVGHCTPPPQLVDALAALHGDGGSLEAALEGLLRALQDANGFRPFGVCHSSRHLQRNAGRPKLRCGLTGEALDQRSTLRICREFQEAVAS
jgi:MarR family transcriptional repressor of emrRAB